MNQGKDNCRWGGDTPPHTHTHALRDQEIAEGREVSMKDVWKHLLVNRGYSDG